MTNHLLFYYNSSENHGLLKIRPRLQTRNGPAVPRTKKKKSSYLLFDDPDIKSIFDDDIKKFEKHYISGKEIAVLDEVHYCKDTGTKLKYLVENGHKLWITSSTEAILAKDVLSYLVGRVSVLH